MNRTERSVHIATLGCKTNHYESEAIAQQFVEAGFVLTEYPGDADISILNTCTVTREAGRKSRQFLRRFRHANPEAFVVAVGCHAQLEDLSDCCDLAIGTEGKSTVVELVLEHIQRQSAGKDHSADLFTPTWALGVPSYADVYEEFGAVIHRKQTRAQVKIEDGCNAFCTYCAIPLARGRVRSRDEEQILNEAALLAADGCREIVLTGIHICSYGLDRHEDGLALARLCRRLAAISGIQRIRLGSLEPRSVTIDFLDMLAEEPKICPHFHLSLQSGSDAVLERMGRRYTTALYRDVVSAIRERWIARPSQQM